MLHNIKTDILYISKLHPATIKASVKPTLQQMKLKDIANEISSTKYNKSNELNTYFH